MIRKLWFLPLIVLMPSTTGWDLSFMPSWWPFFANEVNVGEVYQIIYLPIMIGFSSVVLGHLPKQLRNISSRWLVLSGILIIGLSYLARFGQWLVIVSALLAIFAHEILVIVLNKKEEKGNPFFTHNNDGLIVLAVLPGSPAAEMEIFPGERLVRVNGMKVTHTKELYAALQQNAAFCKLEVVNLEGNVKFLQRSLYVGEHYLLGMVLAPDENTHTYLDKTYTNLFHLIIQKVHIGKKNQQQTEE